MGFLSPKAPSPPANPPPPPTPPTLASNSLAQALAAERAAAAAASGQGFGGTLLTGGQGSDLGTSASKGSKALLGSAQ